LEKHLLDLDEQQKKLIEYCFEKCKIEPPYEVIGGEWYVGSRANLDVDTIIYAISEVYFDPKEQNPKLLDLIDSTLSKLTAIEDEILTKIDFCADFD